MLLHMTPNVHWTSTLGNLMLWLDSLMAGRTLKEFRTLHHLLAYLGAFDIDIEVRKRALSSSNDKLSWLRKKTLRASKRESN